MATTKRRVSRKDFDVLLAQAETDVQPRFRDFPALEGDKLAFLEEAGVIARRRA